MHGDKTHQAISCIYNLEHLFKNRELTLGKLFSLSQPETPCGRQKHNNKLHTYANCCRNRYRVVFLCLQYNLLACKVNVYLKIKPERSTLINLVGLCLK